jgi:ABC-type bacteriocin/lantibiotic exporter with double-glycine peptidase domain
MQRLACVIAAAMLAVGCAGVRGVGRPLEPSALADPAWTAVRGVPHVQQEDADDCGAAAAAMVLAYWRRPAPGEVAVPDGGLRAEQVRTLLRDGGLRSFVIEGSLDDLRHELAAGRPVIVGTMEPISRRKVRSHYVVVVALSEDKVAMMDPLVGLQELPLHDFELMWKAAKQTTVVGLPPR